MSNLNLGWKSVIKRAIVVIFLLCVVLIVFNQTRVREKNAVSVWSQGGKRFAKYTWDSENSTLKIGSTLDEDPYLIPPDNVLQQMSEDDLLRVYWKYINTIQTLCRTQTRVGHLDDGGKEMCIDPLYIPQQPCIVYSFGSNFQFDFDLAMHNHYGCEVFTYDPSMDIKGKIIPNVLKFELRGLAGRDYINDKQWKMSTLESIMRDNGHLNKIIDVLKVDIEGSEWEAIPAILEAGLHRQIKQLLVEIHGWRRSRQHNREFFGGLNMAGQLKVLRRLYENGFHIFMREHNLFSKTQISSPPKDYITIVNELSLINIRFR